KSRKRFFGGLRIVECECGDAVKSNHLRLHTEIADDRVKVNIQIVSDECGRAHDQRDRTHQDVHPGKAARNRCGFPSFHLYCTWVPTTLVATFSSSELSVSPAS